MKMPFFTGRWLATTPMSGLILVVMAAGFGCTTVPMDLHPTKQRPLNGAADRLTAVADTSLFGVVVRAVPPVGGRLLHVDPRPLTADARPHRSASPSALAPVPTELVEARAAVLQQLGVPETDVLKDSRCAFVVGGNPRPPEFVVPPPPDSIRLERERCWAKGRFVSVIFGLPRREVPEAIQSAELPLPEGQRWITRAIEYTDYSHTVLDIVAVQDPDSGWRVVQIIEVFRILS
jgi:hypothetical protein